jgi:Phage tail lysozyme
LNAAGTRRSGTSKFGPFKWTNQSGGQQGDRTKLRAPAEPYTGRHASPRRKPTRNLVGKVVPAAAVAATLAVGAAAYGVAGSGHPQAAQLADSAQPGGLSSVGHVSLGTAGSAEAAASAMTGVVKTASGGGDARASTKSESSTPQASRSAQATGSPLASRSVQAAAKPTSSGAHAPIATAVAATATAAASPSSTAAATTLSCNLSYGLLPANVTAIVSYLLANGYSDNAVAGIAGNMYQESKGNPESEGMGGGGLIGFTPLPYGYVTGNPTADLQTQLAAVLTYNHQWAAYLPELNAAATPADAAYIYVTEFERAGIPAASTREAAAEAVATACDI